MSAPWGFFISGFVCEGISVENKNILSKNKMVLETFATQKFHNKKENLLFECRLFSPNNTLENQKRLFQK